ncbi:MAG: GyrI-like domain-containing protein [Bacillota bacterium]
MEYKAEIGQIPQHTVYFKEYFINDMNDFFNILAERNFLQELSDKVMLENPEIQLTTPDYNVLLFVGGEYRERNVSIEFCDAVTASGKDTDEYKFRVVPAFTALKVLHKGPYKKLSEAYSFAYKWMEEYGYKKAGCPRNSAIDGFWNRDCEEDYLTEIQIPVNKL